MDTGAIKEKISGWLEEKFLPEPEYFLVDIKMQGRKVSVFIDGEKGIATDKLAQFSRYIEKLLDGEMLMGDNYILEVSSPGMDNPFKGLRQFRKNIGRQVSVVKLDGIRIDGMLLDADEDKVLVEAEKKVKGQQSEKKIHELLLNQIKSTKLNF